MASKSAGKQRAARSSNIPALDSQDAGPSGTSQETTSVVSPEQIAAATTADTSVPPPPSAGAPSPGVGSSVEADASTPSFVELLSSSAAPMDVDGAPAPDRLPRLHTLVANKRRTLRNLQEQHKDTFLDSESILQGQPHDQRERLRRERDDHIAAIEANIRQTETELANAENALHRRMFPLDPNSGAQPYQFAHGPQPQHFAPITYQDALNVLPVLTNKEHGALVRIGVKGSIPVFSGTQRPRSETSTSSSSSAPAP